MNPEAGFVVSSLSSAVHGGEHSLGVVPKLLKRVLAEELWQEFVTPRGEKVRHERFEVFVTTPPTQGLGATIELIERIVGTDDPDLLRLLREARKVGQGKRTDLRKNLTEVTVTGQDSSYDADRLSRVAPDEYAAVANGEKSLNAAAKDAGIRKPRVMVRLDNAESAARTLIRHMDQHTRARLKDLL